MTIPVEQGITEVSRQCRREDMLMSRKQNKATILLPMRNSESWAFYLLDCEF